MGLKAGLRAGLTRALVPTLLVLIAAAAIVPAAAASAAPPLLRQFCEGRQGSTVGLGGHCDSPLGIGVDASTGDAYVVDGSNSRIQKFTPWGQFLRTWGWDVVASGPDNKAAKNEIQKVTVDAAGGSFAMYVASSEGLHQSAPIAFNAPAADVQTALETPHLPYDGFKPGDLDISGPVGGPWTIEFTGRAANVDIARIKVVDSSLTGGAATATSTTLQDGGNFEICVAANGDVCKSGQESSSARGLSLPAGIAVDSAGNVYVVDWRNRRVQKFGPDGEFLLMFGGDVNRTKVEAAAPEAQRNLCPVDPGDVCEEGTEGAGNGQFGHWAFGSFIAIDPGSPDTIYVGDQERIQRFDPAGYYTGQIGLPEAGTVGSLAVDPKSGDLYFAFRIENFNTEDEQPNVYRLGSITGEVLDTLKVEKPTAIATDSAGNVYVFDHAINPNNPGNHITSVLNFGPTGDPIDLGTGYLGFGKDEFTESTGIATSSACGIKGVDIFVSNRAASSSNIPSFVGLYGPAPDPAICPPPKVPPSIEDQYVLAVDTDGATARAVINPHFWPDTTYYVQYGTGKCSEGGCEETALLPGAQLGGGVIEGEETTKSVFLGGNQPLLSDTTYHYRFVAQSGGGGPVFGKGGTELAEGQEGTFHTFSPATAANTECPNQVFRTAASALLPDCRAYEMVSPLEKNNGNIFTPKTAESPEQSSPDGNALSFVAGRAFAGSLSAPLSNQYIARRDPEMGWSTQSLNARRSSHSFIQYEHLNARFKAFSEDLCSAWMLQDTPVALTEGAPVGTANLYRRDNCGTREGEFELLTPVIPPGIEPDENGHEPYYPSIQAFSADSSLSVFRAPAPLTPDASTENQRIYQTYAYEEGQLHLISVLPNGSAEPTSSSLGTSEGASTPWRTSSTYHALSADGSRAFWSASGDSSPTTSAILDNGEGPGKLYLRVNLAEEQSALSKSKKCTEAEKACTYKVSELISAAPARFWSADAGGTRVIFSIGEDLYEFSTTADEEGTLSTQASLIAHKVAGVMGASDDARRVYLVSKEVLSETQKNSESAEAKEEEANLYLYEAGEEGAAGSFTFIATLGGGEGEDGPAYAPAPARRTSRVSADGLRAAFTSIIPLTGYENADALSGEPDREVFFYDATPGDSGRLLCVSCNPSGARPAGREVAQGFNGGVGPWAAAQIPGWTASVHPGHVLSDEGSRLFFESFEALITRDTNGQQDVYEWEAPGTGDCTEQSDAFSPPNEGCISLISSGESAEDSSFIDATPSGSDAFFITKSSLLPQDYGLTDAYDARVGGGFPPPPVPPPACEGEACQGSLSPPEDPTPGSSSFRGAGNVVAEGPKKGRCAKGKARRKGRCVAKKHHRKHAKRTKHDRRQGR